MTGPRTQQPPAPSSQEQRPRSVLLLPLPPRRLSSCAPPPPSGTLHVPHLALPTRHAPQAPPPRVQRPLFHPATSSEIRHAPAAPCTHRAQGTRATTTGSRNQPGRKALAHGAPGHARGHALQTYPAPSGATRGALTPKGAHVGTNAFASGLSVFPILSRPLPRRRFRACGMPRAITKKPSLPSPSDHDRCNPLTTKRTACPALPPPLRFLHARSSLAASASVCSTMPCVVATAMLGVLPCPSTAFSARLCGDGGAAAATVVRARTQAWSTARWSSTSLRRHGGNNSTDDVGALPRMT